MASVYQDGTKLFECPNFIPPINTVRNHFLGEGTYDSSKSDVSPLKGAILGLRVTNLGQTPPQHPRDSFQFRNFPGQSYRSPLVASFYARFDNTARRYQRAFDFGNGGPGDNILCCGQYGTTTDMMCEVHYSDGSKSQIIAPNVIDEGVFAFWHFGIDTGNFWIEKNGSQVAQQAVGRLPEPVSVGICGSGSLIGDSIKTWTGLF